MTISSTNTKDQCNGNGVTTSFNYNFKILDKSHVEVIRTDANGDDFVLDLDVDYSVSGIGDDAGGAVSYPLNGDPLPAGEKLTIRRRMEFTQSVDLQNQGGFFAEVHEDAFDRQVMYALQNREELGRAIKFGATADIGDFELPGSATARANKVVSFDKDGNIIVSQEIGSYAGEWQSNAYYGERDFVKDPNDNSIYLCLSSHTSGSSITDHIDQWEKLFDGSTSLQAVEAMNAAIAAKEAATQAADSAQLSSDTATQSAENAEMFSTSSGESSSAAVSAAEKSVTGRDESYRWANENEGEQVADSSGKVGFSAHHWAQKAAASASVVDGKILKDGDGDTYVRTEAVEDEDRVRIGTEGKDRLVVDENGLAVYTESGEMAYRLPLVSSKGNGHTLVIDSFTKELAWDLPPNDGLEDHILLGFDVP